MREQDRRFGPWRITLQVELNICFHKRVSFSIDFINLLQDQRRNSGQGTAANWDDATTKRYSNSLEAAEGCLSIFEGLRVVTWIQGVHLIDLVRQK